MPWSLSHILKYTFSEICVRPGKYTCIDNNFCESDIDVAIRVSPHMSHAYYMMFGCVNSQIYL